MKKFLTIALFSAICISTQADDFAPLFPFQPSHDAPDNITSVRWWDAASGQVRPAGADGFISAKDGSFINGKGEPIRFIGTNICFGGCFPEKGNADRVAKELTRYGINIVRLHYVHHKFPAGKIYPEKDSFLEPEQLDRFDYLFAKLKENGIYTYFQLNIARKFGAQNGFENADKLPWYNNGIDNIDERMIDLQKKYISEILNHVNPYTGLKYKDDPAIAALELANENSILHAWFSPKYDFPELTEPYASQIKAKWNKWLIKKYGSTEKVKQKWLQGLEGDGTEFIPEGILSADANNITRPGNDWGIQNDKISEGTFEVVPALRKDRIDGDSYFTITIDKNGTSKNIPQFFRTGLKFKKGEPYCLKLKMRSDNNKEVGIRFSQHHDPWHVCGMKDKVKLTPEWKEYTFNFTGNMDDDKVRLVIAEFQPGSVDIADISLKSGIDFKWDQSRNIEKGNVDWPHKKDWSLLPQRAYDFTEFLSDVEQAYFDTMRDYVKKTLSAPQPVTGTQLQYGQALAQADMDFCDHHGYWNHPRFPGKSWDSSNWNLGNSALVNGEAFAGSKLASIARNRILGKPFTVSEYDHPSLNRYSAEGNILLAATGAFQAWSALIQFAWSHKDDFFRNVLSPMFDLCSATQKLVHFPACYAMFVRGDVKSGLEEKVYARSYSRRQGIEDIANGQSSYSTSIMKDKVKASLPLSYASGQTLPERPFWQGIYTNGDNIHKIPEVITGEGDIPDSHRESFKNGAIISSTGELTWDFQKKGYCWFRVDTPDTKAFTGFVRGRNFSFNGMTISPGLTRLDWCTITLTSTTVSKTSGNTKDDTGRSSSLHAGSWLLAATGVCQNTDEIIVDLGKDNISCSKSNGGNPGIAPILCEGIPAEICLNGLAGKVKCWALNGNGNRTKKVKVTSDSTGSATIAIGPEYRTVWYELEISN